MPTKVPKSSRSGRSIETVIVYLAILPPLLFAAFGSNPLNRRAQQREMMQHRFTAKLTAVSQTVSNCHFQRPTLIKTFGYRLLHYLKSIQNRWKITVIVFRCRTVILGNSYKVTCICKLLAMQQILSHFYATCCRAKSCECFRQRFFGFGHFNLFYSVAPILSHQIRLGVRGNRNPRVLVLF